MPEVEPIALPNEVGALLRSLGDPPMNNGVAAGHYFSTVIERAAAVAVALAVSADVLAHPTATDRCDYAVHARRTRMTLHAAVSGSVT